MNKRMRLKLDNNLITYTEAAKILGVSRPTIYNYVRRGEIETIKFGKYRCLSKEDIKELRKVQDELRATDV